MGCSFRRLLVSGRGAGLGKIGLGCSVHLRPLGIGESSRRIAARCIALQTKGSNSASADMSQEFQCGVGVQGGVDVGYATPNQALDALVKAEIPSAMFLTDAGKISCSILQNAVFEEVVELTGAGRVLGYLFWWYRGIFGDPW